MKEVYEVLMHIGEDMMEPVGYLPLGIMAGAAYLAGYEVWKRITGKNPGRTGAVDNGRSKAADNGRGKAADNGRGKIADNDRNKAGDAGSGKRADRSGGICLERKWLLTLCIIYTTVILYLAFFSREPGSRTGIDLMLFETWKDSPIAKAYVIENVLMFIPFGILFPAAFRHLRTGVRCTVLGFLSSVCLELAQLATQRGHCQLDDVVMNTLGAWIGWRIYRAVKQNFMDYLERKG